MVGDDMTRCSDKQRSRREERWRETMFPLVLTLDMIDSDCAEHLHEDNEEQRLRFEPVSISHDGSVLRPVSD